MKLIIGAIVIAGITLSMFFFYQKSQQDHGSKQIQVTMIADGNTFYDESVSTDSATLADLLKELHEEKEIVLEYNDGSYGMYITAIGKDELKKEDPTSNVYWTYSSTNNQQCVDAGFCDAANLLNINDQDAFVFELKEVTF